MGLSQAERRYYECTTGGHNKFYEITAFPDGQLTRRWGALGSSGQVQTKKYNPSSVYTEMVNEHYKRIDKGYTLVDTAKLGFEPSEFAFDLSDLAAVE